MEVADLVNGPIIGSSHRARMEALLAHFHRNGLRLVDCAQRKRLNRTVGTLRRYVRRMGLAFPDYAPRALHTKEPT